MLLQQPNDLSMGLKIHLFHSLQFLGIQEQDVDLVVLDMIMEDDFDGLDTFKGIRALRPNQRCIIASGYAETDRVKDALKGGVLNYVRKPYTMHGIATTIRDSLDG